MMIKCFNCGAKFQPGNNAQGTPNGIGFKLESGKLYNVCRFCISYKTEEVNKKIEEMESKK